MSRLHKNKQYYVDTDWTVKKAKKEINDGLKILKKIDNKIVTFFGSHKVNKKNKYYQHCKKLAYELGKRNYAIVSGGGPGIMHAANSGATKAGVPSIGFQAELLTKEKIKESIFTDKLSFHFFFVRRFIMSIKSDALIFYPGGYGSLDELFEYANLMQNNIVDRVPIICVNKKYWKGLFDWLKNNPLKEDFLAGKMKDIDLLHFVDDIDEIIKIIEDK